MRAVLILTVLLLWVGCLCGAVGFPLFLAGTAVYRRSHPRRGGLDRSVRMMALVLVAGYAAVMAVCALAMGVVSRRGETPASWSSVAAWSAAPAWAALWAAVTAVWVWRLGPAPAPAVAGRPGW